MTAIGSGAIPFLAAHVPLAILMTKVSIVTSLHAFVVVAIGLWWAISPNRRLHEVAWVVAYITGAETLWRMTNDALFWEIAKYSVTAILVVAVVRTQGLKGLVRPAVCFALLLPSAFLTLTLQPWEEARNQLSFNLSGPLALAVCAGFFSTVRLSPGQLQRMLVAGIAPIIGVGANVVYAILTNPSLQLFNGSNKYLSGGWAPNQVSASLSLGATFAFLLLIEKAARWELRITMFGLMIWLFFQSALTFSRGGPFCAAGAALMALLCLTRDRRALLKTLGAITLVGAIGYFVIWPRLDEFTAGGLSQRFQNTGTTGRDDLSLSDLTLFAEHPILGVGPGRSAFEHHLGLAAHTEFTRLLAEHGLFGGAVLVLLAATAYQNFRKGASPGEQALAVAMMTWSVLFMANSAMRLVAPALTFGCAFARGPVGQTPSVVTQPAGRVFRRPRRAVAVA